MAVDPVSIAQLGLGLVGGKRSPKNPNQQVDDATKQLVLKALGAAQKYDPNAETSIAIDAAQQDTQKVLERSLGNVFGRFAQQGSMGYLPDTSRNSILRGAASDIANNLAKYEAELKANQTNRFLEVARAAASLRQTAQQAPTPQKNWSPFISAASDISKQTGGFKYFK